MIKCSICGCNDETLCSCKNIIKPNSYVCTDDLRGSKNTNSIIWETNIGEYYISRSSLENNPLSDLVFAHWTNLYILGRISKGEMINRLKASFPDVLDITLAELVEQVEEDKDRFLNGLKGE